MGETILKEVGTKNLNIQDVECYDEEVNGEVHSVNTAASFQHAPVNVVERLPNGVVKDDQGNYRSIFYLNVPMPYEGNFPAAFLFPIVINLKQCPLMVYESDTESYQIGMFSDNLAFDTHQGAIGAEAFIIAEYKDFDFSKYQLDLNVELPDEVNDENATYNAEFLLKNTKIQEAKLIKN